MWIQTGVTVRKRLSWVLTSVTLIVDLWPWPFAWTSLWSLVMTPENFMMIRWWEHCQKGVTDRRTDGQTDGSCLDGAQNTTLGFNSIISVLYTRISTMRCSRDLVVALTDTSDAFLWGLGGPPQLVQHGCDFPREMFAKGDMPDSGGTVFLQWPSGKLWGPGMHENYHWFKRYFSLILGVCWH